jgi:hypothetical protein
VLLQLQELSQEMTELDGLEQCSQATESR